MLQTLRIRNLAVIDDLTWELQPGLNILTGETGAGKSILIDALNLLLGERADKTLMRDGADACAVEALIQPPPSVNEFLIQNDFEPCGEDGLILKRSFTRQGQNRQSINGSPATIQTLRQLGDLLVDLHGPHDHQSLLSTRSQLNALDEFGGISAESYRALYAEQKREQAKLEDLLQTETGDWQSRVDFLAFQIEEIEKAGLKPEEEESLEREYQLASNRRRIVELGNGIRQLIGEGEERDILSQLADLNRLVHEWVELDGQAGVLRELSEGARAQLRELESEAVRLVEQTELDAERLEEIELRLNLLQSLKRKHGSSVEEILEKLEKLREEHDALAGREETIARLEAAIQKRGQQLEKEAAQLSKARSQTAPKLAKAITAQLRALGFKQSDFSIQLSREESLTPAGRDAVEFLFAPNPGESARPLRAIASSGEMARVMLAVKTVLAGQDAIPILIFDEVDANVGGETAVAVGKKLKELGRSHQVLCITHLPQVAGAGDFHYRVEKKIQKGRTKVILETLEGDARLDELSRMLGGKNDSARKLAQTLVER